MKAAELRKRVKAAKKAAYDKWMEEYGDRFTTAADNGKSNTEFVFTTDGTFTLPELKAFLEADDMTVKTIAETDEANVYSISVSWG